MGFSRLFNDNTAVQHFLENCLGIGSYHCARGMGAMPIASVVKQLRDAELLQAGMINDGTLSSDRNRDDGWKTRQQRRSLQERIVEELLKEDRIDKDDEISLGKGGAKPRGSPSAEKKAFLITGLPASGKSSIVAKIADTHSAYVIDPDYVKRKLPEFDGTPAGATLVHEESSAITLSAPGYNGPSLLLTCLHFGFNIVRPMVGADAEKLEQFAKTLKEKGYEVHLTSIILDRKKSALRALDRFLETKRYVSLGYIFDECANDPALVYYKFRGDFLSNPSHSIWTSLGSISTNSAPATKLEVTADSNPANLF